MSIFRENLREELDYQDISVKELSAKTGISKRTIENYLSKRGSIPPADYACKIANLLNVPVEWLVTGTDGSVP
jgi:transcriptional regulator with XRE-family HTH domain